MKISISRTTHLLWVCGTLLVSVSFPLEGSTAERDTIRIAVEGAFPPFNYLDANKKLQGFDVDLAEALCKTEGLNCEFVVQEWTGMIPNLLANRYDTIISSMSMSGERRKQVAFSRAYYDSPSVLIVRKDMPSVDVGAKGNGMKLGVTASTSQEAYAKAHFADASVTVFDSSPELYKGLAEGNVDIILEDKLAVYDWLANTKEGSCCKFLGADIKSADYFGDGAGIAVRPADQDLLARFNSALDKVQSDGTYDAINAKYFPFSIR